MKYIAKWHFGDYMIEDDNDYGVMLARIDFTHEAKERLLESDMELLADIFAERITKLIKERQEEGNILDEN